MARPLRIDIADGWYHVTARGIERRSIFTEDREREHFLELLEAAVERYRICIHAYVLMSNHYHLLARTPEANLSETIQWLNVSYSVWFNRRRDRVGPLFQGRFKSLPVENGDWAYELSLYVHLNPVMRAGLSLGKKSRRAEAKGWKEPSTDEVRARLAELRRYPWSSYRAYAGYVKPPEWLETGEILGRATREADKRVETYRSAVKYRLTQGVSEPFSERLKERIALGTAKFVNEVKAGAKSGRETTGKRMLGRKVGFEEAVKLVEGIRGSSYEEFMKARGDWGRPLLMWGLRTCCGMTLKEIGEHMGGVDYSAAQMMIKRFTDRASADAGLSSSMKSLKRLMLNVET